MNVCGSGVKHRWRTACIVLFLFDLHLTVTAERVNGAQVLTQGVGTVSSWCLGMPA